MKTRFTWSLIAPALLAAAGAPGGDFGSVLTAQSLSRYIDQTFNLGYRF